MAVIKCKMCGGDLVIEQDSGIAICEYCGTKQTVSKTTDDVVANLYNRANNLRMKCEFDKAAQAYEKIVQQDDSEAEAHWGIVLCKYGIEYVDDPATGKKIPTCHRTLFDAVTADADYQAAVDYADSAQQAVYETEARAIDRLQKDILAIVKNEKPFDVFICYKETDESGKRTVDSALANDIYHQLTAEGLKVFYAAITLEDKLGQEYEPYIFAALNSAKVMLVVGTKPEYFNAVWVKNEWSRFLALMKSDPKKLLIPCYRDMDAYDLPEEFAHLQAQDMTKIGFVNDIVRGIKKVAGEQSAPATAAAPAAPAADTAPLLKRAFMFLEDGDWQSADEYCEKVLDIDPENAEAYLGKLMAELHVRKREQLAEQNEPFDSNKNYQKAIRFGDDALKTELDDYASQIPTSAKSFVFSENADGYSVDEFNDEKCSIVNIPWMYKGKPVNKISYRAFSGCVNLTSIIIPNGVTSIDDAAFNNCKNLMSIIIPDSVTSIGNLTFSSCKNLTDIAIPNGVTSIGYSTFSLCENLTSITIPDSVTNIGSLAFSGCKNLTSVTIPDSVTDIAENAFSGCKKLTIIWDGEDNASSSASEKMLLNKEKTVLFVFQDDEAKDVTIPSGVTTIGEGAFSGCNNLLSVTLPDSVTSIGDYAFTQCENLTNITIPDSVTSIGEGAFSDCDSLAYNEYDNALYLGNSANPYAVLDMAKNISIASCTIHSQTRLISEQAFVNRVNLTSIIIPDGVTSIGALAFDGCKNLKSITIPDSVTNIGSLAFSGCNSIETVVCSGDYEKLKKAIQGNSDDADMLLKAIEEGMRGQLERQEAEKRAEQERQEAERKAAEEREEAKRKATEEKAEAERMAAEEKAEAERMAAALKRKTAEIARITRERAEKKAKLEAKQLQLQTELANLKGLFTGKRRKEIEARLAAIASELKTLG